MGKWVAAGLLMMSVMGTGLVQETGAIKLLPPERAGGGKPLMQALDAGAEQKALYSAADTGFIAQNGYLFCASAGLATVVRGSVDRQARGAASGLGGHQQVILAQSVGYPAGSAR